MTVEEATDMDIFLAYLGHVLCPKMKPGGIVAMDNLSSQRFTASNYCNPSATGSAFRNLHVLVVACFSGGQDEIAGSPRTPRGFRRYDREGLIKSIESHSGAEQAAEKLNFSEGVKNGSRQDAPGTVREA
ncbi:MAG: hypothetical protein ACYCOR_02995 [Acidobacteriaceae bacterium]